MREYLTAGTARPCIDFGEYHWGNPQAVRTRAKANYGRILTAIKVRHRPDEWENAQAEAALRRAVLNDALVVVHGRNEEEAVRLFNCGELKSSAALDEGERSLARNSHTRNFDVDIGLDQYVFFSFKFDCSFGDVFFVFSNQLCSHPNFFVTSADISAVIDLDSYDEGMRGMTGASPLSNFPEWQKTMQIFMNKVLAGEDYLTLLSLLSVLEFRTFEDSVKYYLRGSTRYGAPGAGIKCCCLHETGAFSHDAEGKIFGGVEMSLLQEIVVDHPHVKERLIAGGLPADLIVVVREICDSYEERFRLRAKSFRELIGSEIRGLMPWSDIVRAQPMPHEGSLTTWEADFAEMVRQQYQIPHSQYHPWAHTLRVVEYGRRIARVVCPEHMMTVLIGAYLHDIGRESEEDGDHGLVGAVRAFALYPTFLSDLERRTLEFAITHHSDPRAPNREYPRTENYPEIKVKGLIEPVIAAIWDADRLDFSRCYEPVDPRYLSTETARTTIV